MWIFKNKVYFDSWQFEAQANLTIVLVQLFSYFCSTYQRSGLPNTHIYWHLVSWIYCWWLYNPNTLLIFGLDLVDSM